MVQFENSRPACSRLFCELTLHHPARKNKSRIHTLIRSKNGASPLALNTGFSRKTEERECTEQTYTSNDDSSEPLFERSAVSVRDAVFEEIILRQLDEIPLIEQRVEWGTRH